jgi:superfamily II DNA/RNA helicase
MTESPAAAVAEEPAAATLEAPQPRFDELGLSPDIMRAIDEAGYSTPTPIQAKAIPIVLQGRDVLGIAQTGTGKTAAFTIPMIEILAQGRAKARMPRTLILEPTRELAAQVAESFDKYGKYHKLTKALLIGGVSFADQEALLTQGVDVLIATPGRLLDHFERGKLLLSGVQVMVVDEADRMLDMGFIPDIERIFKLTPFTRQTLFFSATMPPEITRLTEQFLSNAARIEASRPAQTAVTITARIVKTPSGDPRTRRAALRAIIKGCANLKNGIIFCNRKTDVDVVAKSLQRHGFNAAPIHGDLDQSVRLATLARFKSGEVPLLVASDVAARGLDIPDVSHVFNYEPPRHAEDYVHRIGRTGRAGRLGEAYTLVAPNDDKSLSGIEKLIKQSIPAAEFDGVPSERLPDDGRDAKRPGRSDKRGRGGDRSDRRPPRDDRPPREAAADEAPKPRRDDRGRISRRPSRTEEPEIAAAAQDAPAPARPPRAPRLPRAAAAPPSPAPRKPAKDDAGPLGFGDDAPAFLFQAAPRKKR